MTTLRFKEAQKSTWPTGSEWVWLEGRVRFMNGVDTGVSNATTSLLIVDKSMVTLTLQDSHSPEEAWDKISMELLNHGIMCEPLHPISDDGSIPLPPLDAP